MHAQSLGSWREAGCPCGRGTPGIHVHTCAHTCMQAHATKPAGRGSPAGAGLGLAARLPPLPDGQTLLTDAGTSGAGVEGRSLQHPVALPGAPAALPSPRSMAVGRQPDRPEMEGETKPQARKSPLSRHRAQRAYPSPHEANPPQQEHGATVGILQTQGHHKDGALPSLLTCILQGGEPAKDGNWQLPGTADCRQ